MSCSIGTVQTVQLNTLPKKEELVIAQSCSASYTFSKFNERLA